MKKPVDSSTWCYGVNPVLEALGAGAEIRQLVIGAGKRQKAARIIEAARARGIEPQFIHDPGYFDARFPKGHQDVAAELGGAAHMPLDELLELPVGKGEPAFFVVLDELEDPRNVGAIVRSAEAMGAHGVVVQERRSASLGSTAYKASAGAMGLLPICSVPNVKNAMDAMMDQGIMLIGAEAGSEAAPWEADLTGPLALVIGSEGKGLRRVVKERCDSILTIPMTGRVNSLNASVAAGVLIYEVRRQRASGKSVG